MTENGSPTYMDVNVIHGECSSANDKSISGQINNNFFVSFSPQLNEQNVLALLTQVTSCPN